MLFPPPQPSRPPLRVAVTGAGIVTALGTGWAINASGFRTGRVALRPVGLFDVSRQRARVAGEMSLEPPLPCTRLPRRAQWRTDRAGRALLWAAHEAWLQSGWTAAHPLALVVGTTSAGMPQGEAFYRQRRQAAHNPRHQAERAQHYQAQRQALDVVDAFGLCGSITLISNACASGANTIGHAWELLRSGRAARALAGGYEGLCQTVYAGFDSLQALSPTGCRPFDAHRDGLSLGEGAALLALEPLDDACRRGATILGEIVGYGASTDGYHLTQPHPQGDAALASMAAACGTAGVGPIQIDYVNAHGTGTPLNDAAEAIAIQRWAGTRVATLPVSSVKSGIGHLLGAAGAVEAVVCLMALRGQWLPPTLTIETPDPVCQFPLVRHPTDARLDYVLSNSFGFGGANATLIFRRWP